MRTICVRLVLLYLRQHVTENFDFAMSRAVFSETWSVTSILPKVVFVFMRIKLLFCLNISGQLNISDMEMTSQEMVNTFLLMYNSQVSGMCV